MLAAEAATFNARPIRAAEKKPNDACQARRADQRSDDHRLGDAPHDRPQAIREECWAVICQFVHDDGAHAHQNAPAKGDKHHLQRGRPIEHADRCRCDQAEHAEQLHHRRQQFSHHEIGEYNRPGRAEVRVAKHRAMSPQRVGKATLPSLALPTEPFEGARRFSPRDRVRDERHAGGLSKTCRVTVKLQHDFHVFSDCPSREASDIEQRLASEQTEGAGNDQPPADAIPTQTSDQECPQVLYSLRAGKQPAWYARVADAPGLYARAIRDADHAASRHHGIVAIEFPHQTVKRIRFNERVGVEHTDEATGCEVQAHVECIRFAAVHPGCHHQFWIAH